jgi:hypothetical protein
LGSGIFVALHFPLKYFSTFTEFDEVDTDPRHYLCQLHKLDYTRRILRESGIVRSEPADEQVPGSQTELGCDRLITCITGRKVTG